MLIQLQKEQQVMRSKATKDKAHWLKHIESYKASGMNKNKYCDQHGITYHRFLYWFDKLTSKSLQLQTIRKNTNKANQFIKVKLNSKPDQMTRSIKPLCILELKQGHRLFVHDEAALEKLFLLLSK